MLAKWLARKPQVVVLDEPTRGIDVGARSSIYALIRQMAASGCIVLLHSNELSELTGLCDRILALHQGRLDGEIAGDDMDVGRLLKLITAGKPADENRQTSRERAA